MPRDPRTDAGFTLVELLVVLTILSLLVGLALPYLGKRLPAAALGGAAQELRAALDGARSAAIAEDREIAFTGAANGYRVDGVRHDFAPGADLRLEIRGGSRISFFPSGGSSGGIVLLRGATAEREIEIETITGRVLLLP